MVTNGAGVEGAGGTVVEKPKDGVTDFVENLKEGVELTGGS
jgi:hypothetical protein